jgi:hypothetical protein
LGKGCFFLKKNGDILFPECLGWGTRGRRFFKKIEFLPRVLHSGKMIFIKKKINCFPECCGEEVFQKKRLTTPTASNLSQVLGRHSGKASPSVRFLALGEDLFPMRGIPGGTTLGEAGFLECFGAFPECIWHSGKRRSPVVYVR